MNPPPDDTQVLPIADLTAQPVHWLWPGRLALGKLSLLEGDPGLGKSLVTLDLCARLSRGLPFPDGAARLRALQHPRPQRRGRRRRHRARPPCRPRRRPCECLRPGPVRPRRRRPAPAQRARPAEKGPHPLPRRLAVLDPLLAFLDPAVTSGNDQGVRRALTPLASLASSTGCAS